MARASTSVALALALLVHARLSPAATTTVPTAPAAFEPVTLDIDGVQCGDIVGYQVRSNGDAFQLTARRSGSCFGVPVVFRAVVPLGRLPAGDYRVEIDDPRETVTFSVLPRPAASAVPASPLPLTEYTGLWSNPNESGWGLSIHQGLGNSIFGVLFVYGENGEPRWFSLQGGRWTSSTRWTATLYATTGPFLSNYDPRLVAVQAAGTASLDFTDMPANGTARFVYTLDHIAVDKRVSRTPI
jgi:hypothetical protein